MRAKRNWSWIPLGIMAAVLLTLAVAWAFRDRGARRDYCAERYAAAATAADSLRVDGMVVPMSRADDPLTCGELMGRP